MLYVLLVLLLGFIITFFLNLRVSFEFIEDRKLLFAGIGKTGFEFDLIRKSGTIKLFGRGILQYRRGGKRLGEKREELLREDC